MNQIVFSILTCFSGIFLGCVFYGGLWWTIRMSLSSQRPGILFLSSILLRMGFALIGFYLVAIYGWQYLLLCLLGFLMARAGVTWITQSSLIESPLIQSDMVNETILVQENKHAP